MKTRARFAVAEMLAVVATGAGHVVFWLFSAPQALFIAAALASWSGYLIWRARKDPTILSQWGLGLRGIAPACTATALFFIIATSSLAARATFAGTLQLHVHMIPLLLLYPIWGLAQQLLVQGMLSRNLLAANLPWSAPGLIVPLAAVLFAIVHLPDLALTAATFLLGLALTPIYLRWRNLWPLGVCHGWLGVLTYFWLLGEDPWVEIFR